ncbi:MAG: AAA family ATPase [Metamycoplasmataceae bacterium]
MNRKNIISRKVSIKNFRNIITPTNEQHLENLKNYRQDGNELILNHNNREGGVVLLIGPNNSGKSNILDAIEYYRSSIKERKPASNYGHDFTNFYLYKWYDIKNVQPNWYHTDKEKAKYITSVEISNFNSNLYSVEEISQSEIFNDLYWDRIIKSKCYNKAWSKNKDEVLITLTNEGKFSKFLATIIWIFSNIKFGVEASLIELPKQDIIQLSKKNFNSLRWLISGEDWLCKIMRDNEIINVIRYDEKFEEIIDKDLDINLIGNKSFVNKFFAAINNGSELRNKYLEVYKNKKQFNCEKFSIYEDIIHRINKSLIDVSNKFNELYSLSNEKYIFELRRKEKNNIYRLSLFLQDKNNENVMINLDEQSWGFKWFFNFFFNVFSNKMPYPGDIILLEEPGVNLHVEGQRKWMKFVREFAETNKLTFVITTHSPFLINPDRLDEIRIIYKEGKYCKINNYFYVNVDESENSQDSLESIKKSMTFQNMTSIIYGNDNSKFYLVEDIIDYATLTFFKRIDEKYNGLHFMPINGLGKQNMDDKKNELLIDKILNIYGNNVKILIDNVEAGKKFEKFNKDFKTGLEIFKLSDSNKNNTGIESLFFKDDLQLIQNSKEDENAKNAFESLGLLALSRKPENYFSLETINNFKNVFDKLLEN